MTRGITDSPNLEEVKGEDERDWVTRRGVARMCGDGLAMDAGSLVGVAELNLPAHVRACRAGDWLIFMDLRGNRYWALSARAPIAQVEREIRARWSAGAEAQIRQAPHASSILARILRCAPDLVLVAEAALWAGDVVKRGRLDRAFAWIEASKADGLCESGAVKSIHERFERLRAWVPRPYACLFNSLSLMRFLLRRGRHAELVFGVRAMPFAAHCWVEADGAILDPGEEDCATFTEIARA